MQAELGRIKIIIFIVSHWWCLALHRAGDDFENVVDGLNRDALFKWLPADALTKTAARH
jgi:hypothetical protein